jgi:enoyl-CoA hydratase/carnithine racemase
MNSFKTIKLESGDRITTLTFKRGQTLNSITSEFMEELGAVVDLISHNSETRCLIITGSGRAFCSGLDLNLLTQVGTTIPLEDTRAMFQRWQEGLRALENLPYLTIAAINGLTLGAGVELILTCDFRIASTRAIFGMPEVKLGIIPELGGITRLTRTVGPAWTKEIIFRSRNFSAMEALRVGLINRVSEPGDLMGTAQKWAAQFAALPLPAVQRAKSLINTAFDVDLATGLKRAQDALMELVATDESRGALQAAREEQQVEG